MATPEQRLLTEAAFTQKLTTALPDTGARNISALCLGLTSGTVLFQSKNGWNILTFGNALFTYEGTTHAVNDTTSLAAWAPIPHLGGKGYVVGASPTVSYRAQMGSTGVITLYGSMSGQALNGQLVWPMNRTQPATPPGIAA